MKSRLDKSVPLSHFPSLPRLTTRLPRRNDAKFVVKKEKIKQLRDEIVALNTQLTTTKNQLAEATDEADSLAARRGSTATLDGDEELKAALALAERKVEGLELRLTGVEDERDEALTMSLKRRAPSGDGGELFPFSHFSFGTDSFQQTTLLRLSLSFRVLGRRRESRRWRRRFEISTSPLPNFERRISTSSSPPLASNHRVCGAIISIYVLSTAIYSLRVFEKDANRFFALLRSTSSLTRAKMSSVELDFPMRKAKITYGRRRASSGVSRISNNSPAPLTDTDSSDEGESVAVERSLVKGKGKGKERASPAKKSKVESPRARTEDVVEWDEGVVQSTSKLAVSPSAAKGVKWPKKSGKRSRDEQGNFIKREPATVIPAPTKRSVTLSNPIPHASTPKRSPTRPKSTRSSLPNPIPPPAKPATTPTKRQIIKEPATAPIATNQPTASTSTAIREIDLLDSPYPDKKKARISDPVAPVVIEPPSPAPVSPAKDLSSVFSMYASSDRNLVAVAGKRKTLGKTGSGLISQLGARSIRLTGDGVAEPTIGEFVVLRFSDWF